MTNKQTDRHLHFYSPYSGLKISHNDLDTHSDLGVNHQTSHDGLFKIKAKNISQDILNEIGGIKLTLSGSYINMGKKNNQTIII